MKSLYVSSLEPYSGKTAVCLAIGRKLKADGYKVKYLKPISLKPVRLPGRIADEDAVFVKEALNLPEAPWDLSPVVVTPEVIEKQISGDSESHLKNLLGKVTLACDASGTDCEVLLLEGSGNLREGYFIDLPAPVVVHALGSDVLLVARFFSESRLLDDILSYQARLHTTLQGVIINRVPAGSMDFVREKAIPYLEKRGIPVYGFIPEEDHLAALMVQDLISILQAEVLTHVVNPEAMVETISVGAMTARSALAHFKALKNKAVITGGDRTEIQLAALETSTTCLILTGNIRPSALLVRQADESGIPVLLVTRNTMETVKAIESIFGATRLSQQSKLELFEKAFLEHTDLARLFGKLGL